MTSSALNLMPMLNQQPDYASLGQWGRAPLMEIPGVTTPVAPSQMVPMSTDRFMGLAGTFGDQAGDYAMPSMGVNPGWASGGMPSLGSDGFSLSDWISGKFSALGDFAKSSGMVGSRLSDGTRVDGWGGLAVGAAGTLLNGYMGFQNLKLAKDQLAFQKDAFAKNWGAQKTMLNSQLEDRQRARVASNAGAYESVDSYMGKNRIK